MVECSRDPCRPEAGSDAPLHTRYLDAGFDSPLANRTSWVTIRGVALLAAALVAIVFTPLDERGAVAGVLTVAATAQFALRAVGRDRNLAPWLAIVDLSVAATVTVAEPALWPAATMWIGAVITWQAVSAPRSTATVLMLASAAATAAVGAVAGIPSWWIVVVTQVILSAGYALFGVILHRELLVSEHELMATVTAAGAVVSYIDLEDGRMIQLSGDVQRVTGYTGEQWRALDHRSIVHPDDVAGYWIDPESVDADRAVDRIGRIRAADGRWIWIRDVARIHVDRTGRRTMRGFFVDITELVETNRRATEQSRLDVVTGLPNRLALLEQLDGRLTAGEQFALLLIDLDRFKEVNDILGHEAGDKILGIVGARLAAAIRPGDHLSRLGGDEFAVVLGGARTPCDIAPVLDHLSTECARPVTVRGIRLATSMSTGVTFAGTGADRASLMRHADIAMYEAKRLGLGYRVFDDSLEQTSTIQLSLSAALPDALASGEIRLDFQPSFDLATGELVGAEGLARWHHPELGLLTPDAFLELTLMSEWAAEFTARMAEQAIVMIAHARDVGFPISVAVNVAMRSLCGVGFTTTIFDLLDRHGVPPELLTLEITESDVLQPTPEVIAVLDEITARGVALSVDDFGTGHSSLDRLRLFRVDELKIDRSFVRGIDDPRDRQIVRTIIDLADGLGYRVVAEGVERWDQACALRSMGCPTAQGFLFSPAVPSERFLELLHEHAASPQPVALLPLARTIAGAGAAG